MLEQKLQRESLMERYSDGGFLSEEELRYLANTSELLNRNSDKK
jgi:hypothetical protein